MTYRAVVRNGVVELPPGAGIADGTEVDVSVRLHGTKLGDLLKYAGTWHGEDADEAGQSPQGEKYTNLQKALWLWRRRMRIRG